MSCSEAVHGSRPMMPSSAFMNSRSPSRIKASIDAAHIPLYLKPRTPRTPLLGQFGVKNICGNVKKYYVLVSPDCHALEERFRTLIESSVKDILIRLNV